MSPKIIETQKLESLFLEAVKQAKVGKKVRAVFDIDSTLVTATSIFPNDRFLSLMHEKSSQSNFFKAAISKLIKIYVKSKVMRAMSEAPMRLTEEEIPERLNSLLDMGVEVDILTARPAYAKEATTKLLRSVNINYSHLILTDEKNKGEAYIKHLHQMRLEPDVILFADDNRNNVENFTAVFKEHKEVKTFHYTGCEAAFTPQSYELGVFEFRYYMLNNRLLSDEEAKMLQRVQTP